MAETGSGRRHWDRLRRVLYLGSAVEIAEALAVGSPVAPDEMREAFETFESSGPAEQELLAFVREIYERVVATISPLQEDDPGRALAAAASRETLFGALEVLRPHREALSGAHFETISASAGADSPWGWGWDPFDGRVCAAVVCGMLLEDAGARVEALRLWGARCREEGRIDAARRRFRRAAEIAREEGIADDDLRATGLESSLAVAERDLPAARKALLAQVKMAEERGEDEFAFRSRKSLASVLQGEGRYGEALDVIARRLSYAEGLEGVANRRARAEVLRAKGLILEDVGRIDEAEPCYVEAAELSLSTYDRVGAGIALTNHAGSALKRGDTATAIRRAHELLQTAEGWAAPSLMASTGNNLGNLLLNAGRIAQARPFFEAALAGKATIGDREGQAIARTGLADVWRKLGDPTLAGELLAHAWVNALDAESHEAAFIVADRATRLNGFDQRSRLLLEWVWQLAAAVGDLRTEIAVATTFAHTALEAGADALAEHVSRTTLRRAEAAGSDRLALLGLTAVLGEILGQRPETRGEAEKILTEAVEAIEEEAAASPLAERHSEVVADFFHVYAARAELLVRDGTERSGEMAFQLHERAKARSFVAALASTALTAPEGIPAELREEELRLLAVNRDLQGWHLPRRQLSVSYRRARLKELGEQLQRCWREIEPYDREYVRLRRGGAVDVAQARELLAASSGSAMALVSFFCGARSTTAIVVRSDAPDLHAFRLPVGRSRLGEAATGIRQAFNGDPHAFPPLPPVRGANPGEAGLGEMRSIGEALAGFLPALEGVDLVCVAPHGPLHGLPLHALKVDGGFLAERYAMVYVPSASALSYCMQRHPAPTGPPSSVYLAGVAADEDGAGSHLECDRALFDSSWEVTSDLGLEGTPEAARAGLAGCEVAHITCHGYFDELRPLDNGLALSDGRIRPPRDPRTLARPERDRLLLTGRHLIQTPNEARLVTLRACSTGLQSQRNPGDEFDGLVRSLLFSGTAAAMVNLWNVDRSSSGELMRSFYRHWRSEPDMEKWRALWKAQRELREDRSRPHLAHPYHWAPTILVGDWR